MKHYNWESTKRSTEVNFSLLWYNHMVWIHQIYKLQVKPSNTTSINLGICCKVPRSSKHSQGLITADPEQRNNWHVKVLCLGWLWVQAKHTQTDSDSQYSKCKKHFEPSCRSLTGSAGFTGCQIHAVCVIVYWAPGRWKWCLECFENNVMTANP